MRDAGHTSEVLDLYADKFDPVFRDRDSASYISADIPDDILELMDLRTRVMQSCRWPGQRWLASRALRGKSQAEIAALIRSHMPKDVLSYQAKVAAADALAFVAPDPFLRVPVDPVTKVGEFHPSAGATKWQGISKAGSTGSGPWTSRSG